MDFTWGPLWVLDPFRASGRPVLVWATTTFFFGAMGISSVLTFPAVSWDSLSVSSSEFGAQGEDFFLFTGFVFFCGGPGASWSVEGARFLERGSTSSLSSSYKKDISFCGNVPNITTGVGGTSWPTSCFDLPAWWYYAHCWLEWNHWLDLMSPCFYSMWILGRQSLAVLLLGAEWLRNTQCTRLSNANTRATRPSRVSIRHEVA